MSSHQLNVEEFQHKLVSEQDKLRQLLPQEHQDDCEREERAEEDVEQVGVVAQQVVVVKYLKVRDTALRSVP